MVVSFATVIIIIIIIAIMRDNGNDMRMAMIMTFVIDKYPVMTN